jgi:2,3-dihydroxybiphenyl 1,2-dioxygenase
MSPSNYRSEAVANVTQLGYLGIGVKSSDEWESYSESLLGIKAASRDGDGTLFLRMDDHHHRFALHEDGRDDVLYAGWQVENAADLEAVSSRLSDAGVAVSAGTQEDRERRRVAGLIKFQDPDGLDVELFRGPELIDSHFESTKEDTRFVTGSMGLGHVVFAVQNLETTMDFYTDLLGMKVSDYIRRGRMNLGFLHCNPRHHSIAFAQAPGAPKRTNHFMLQVDSLDTVGRTYDDVQGGAAPLLVTLGRHSNDEMVSFYASNPSGFGVEYGWGALEIDDSCWEVQELDTTSSWGHEPLRTGGRKPQS